MRSLLIKFLAEINSNQKAQDATYSSFYPLDFQTLESSVSDKLACVGRWVLGSCRKVHRQLRRHLTMSLTNDRENGRVKVAKEIEVPAASGNSQ